MPRISAFFGIVIRMYWNERDHPIPHFHAEYGDQAAAISVDGEVLGGTRTVPSASSVSGRNCTAPSSSPTGSGHGA